jgi:GTP cyclohydrolase I
MNSTDTLLRGHDGAVDSGRIERAVREILESIGEDTDGERVRGTPERVARMYCELFAGLAVNPAEYLRGGFEDSHQEMVVLRDIPFFSMCEHHLLPFHGTAHVGYIPSGRLAGLSKIARVVEAFARRPQLQERLTSQIADCMDENLDPSGVGVVIEAEHLCMTMRGVRKPGSRVTTSAMRGSFQNQDRTRSEFLSLVHGA